MTTTPETLVGLSDSTLALQTTTDVATSLADVGSDFASLLDGVSSAVALTAQQFTENGANATSALANTLVDIIAVQEAGFDDNGITRNAVSIKQKLPALALVSAVYEEIPSVRLQAQFRMSEFVTSGTSSTSGSSSGFGVGLGISLQKKAFPVNSTDAVAAAAAKSPGLDLSASLGGGFASSSSSTSVSTQSDQASAVGQMRLFERIEAREIAFPQPQRVIVGPGITCIAADLQETTDTDQTLIRTLSAQINLRTKNGDPIQGKALSIDTEGVPWTFVPDETAKVTDSNGNIEIQLKRTFPKQPAGAPPLDTSPKPTVVSAIFGFVSNRTVVTI